MIDTRFFQKSSPLSLQEIVSLTEAKLDRPLDASLVIHDVAPLEEAGPQHITCCHNPKYLNAARKTQGGFCFIKPEHASHLPVHTVPLVTRSPYRAFALVAQAFYPQVDRDYEAGEVFIHPTAALGKKCIIEPGAIIHRDAVLGDSVCVGSHSVIGKGVVIGPGTRIECGASLSHCLVGSECLIGPGVRIGQAGFGFFMDEKGHVSVPQLGRVVVGDRVEIGANTTIDRGSLRDTQIGTGCRLDNLVQIAHNVILGKGCVVVSQAGIAGSSVLGDYVIVAGQVGIAGHVTIGSGVRVAAQSGVMRDIAPGETVAGTPSVPVTQWHRQTVTLSQLVKKGKNKG
jgi:UDP-3-O-[3-hydroxymyristoyl] glucosamine N-acyltransferase